QYAEALYNRGNALRALNRCAEAVDSYDKAIAIRPDLFEALNNRGNALRTLDRQHEAVESYDRALAVRPDDAGALNNRGNALCALNRIHEAIESYGRALAITPDDARIRLDESLSRLVLGDFERGWISYEWRWKSENFSTPARNFARPLWLGDEN